MLKTYHELEASILEHMKAIEQARKKMADLIGVAIWDDMYTYD